MTYALEVNDLSYRYSDGKEALREVNFTVMDGESVAVLGPNGAGKSTLLLHLNGVLPEQLGSLPAVTVYGLPITVENLPSIHRSVGLLFQNPDDQLFCATVFEDVAFGPQQFGYPEERIRSIVKEMLERVGLPGVENNSPHHLSGGEKQRVCLAGVLACHPRILVLDEPTRDLDPRGKRELRAILKSLPTTKIIATHDLELAVELCDRAILLDGGRIVANAPTIRLLSDEGLMLAHGLEKPHILQHRHQHGPAL
jgi:energy-coupling factor transporter ATP-binding protein EcfA2